MMKLLKLTWEAVLEKNPEHIMAAKEFLAWPINLKKAYQEIEDLLSAIQSDFEGLIHKLSENNLRVDDIQKSRHLLRSLEASEDFTRQWLWAFQDLAKIPFATPLHFMSAYQDRLEHLKSVTYLVGHLMDLKNSGGVNESGTRKVSSERSPEA